MKSYIIITGIIFVLLFIAHVARVVVEGSHPLTEPIFLLTTFASVGMAVWAIYLFKKITVSR